MRVEHRKVKGSNIEVGIGDGDKHSAVHDGGSARAKDHTARLGSAARVALNVLERGVRRVELRDPCDKL